MSADGWTVAGEKRHAKKQAKKQATAEQAAEKRARDATMQQRRAIKDEIEGLMDDHGCESCDVYFCDGDVQRYEAASAAKWARIDALNRQLVTLTNAHTT